MMDDYRNFSRERILPVPRKEVAVERFMAMSDDRLSSQIFHENGDRFNAMVTSSRQDFKYPILVKSPRAYLNVSIQDIFDSTEKFNRRFGEQKTIFHSGIISPEYMMDVEKINTNCNPKKRMPAISPALPLQCVGHRNQDKSRFAEGALITKFYSEGSIFLRGNIDDVNEQKLKSKSQTFHNVSMPVSEKYKTKIYVVKSILATPDKENVKYYANAKNCVKQKEDHGKIINKNHDGDRNGLFSTLKRALSLDKSLHSNICDVNVIDNNITDGKIISKNFTFLCERKLPKLRYSQFNYLLKQNFH